jgi:hypothetical protein
MMEKFKKMMIKKIVNSKMSKQLKKNLENQWLWIKVDKKKKDLMMTKKNIKDKDFLWLDQRNRLQKKTWRILIFQ